MIPRGIFGEGAAPPVTVDWDFGVIFNQTLIGVPDASNPVSDVDFYHIPWNYTADLRTNRAGYSTSFGRDAPNSTNTGALNYAGTDRLRGAHYPNLVAVWRWRFDVPTAGRTYRFYHAQGDTVARGVNVVLYDGNHTTGTVFYGPATTTTNAGENVDLESWSSLPLATVDARLAAEQGYVERTMTNNFVTLEVNRGGAEIGIVNYFRAQRLSP